MISGSAKATCRPNLDSLRMISLERNQSVDIPLWLSPSPGKRQEPLVIIEVHSSDCLDEGDIERNDVYGRS